MSLHRSIARISEPFTPKASLSVSVQADGSMLELLELLELLPGGIRAFPARSAR